MNAETNVIGNVRNGHDLVCANCNAPLKLDHGITSGGLMNKSEFCDCLRCGRRVVVRSVWNSELETYIIASVDELRPPTKQVLRMKESGE